ncbi:hypothetical protein TorRG33x02_248300 [Trema orientale]|uniref:Uncharacterized protein n=1 Tax=Trema orientale TaxID=63057 RepID=A0A2P5DL96_TREOI|nr:hypothetical protein TorRG33x02_248300 [Trema orientale]
MADLELTTEDIQVKACELVSELRNSIQKANKKIQGMSTTTVTALCADPSGGEPTAVSEFFELTKDQRLLKRKFDEIRTDFFSSDQGKGIELLAEQKTDRIKLIVLKRKLAMFKKEEEERYQKLTSLEFKLKNCTISPSDGGDSQGESTDDDDHLEGFKKEEEEQDRKPELDTSNCPNGGTNSGGKSGECSSNLGGESQIKEVQKSIKQPWSKITDVDDRLEGSKKEEEGQGQNWSTLESKSELDTSNSGGESEACSNNGGGKAFDQSTSKRTDDDFLDNPGFVHTDESSSSSSSSSVDSMNTNRISSFLLRKLKLIQYYYLSNSLDQVSLVAPTLSLDSEMQLKFNWLRDRKGDDFEEESTIDSGSGVRNEFELDKEILRLTGERRKEVAEARKGKKLSYIEWLIRDRGAGGWTPLNVVQSKVNEIGNLLCCHLSDLLFVVSENSGQYEKCNDFKHLLKLLKGHQGKTNAIKRIHSVFEAAERELVINGKFKFFESLEGSTERVDHQGSHDDNDNEMEIHRIMDMFLREVLCLESILSYPNMSELYSTLDKELKTIQSGLEECKKEVDKIGSKVTEWKTIHCFILENTGEDVLMKEFQRKLRDAIDSQWKRLDE